MKVILSIAAVLLAVTLVRANPYNPCTAVEQLYAYPGDITKYIHCTSATSYEVMPCAAGTVWDQSQQRCEHGLNDPYNPCTAVGQKFSFPSDITRFIHCTSATSYAVMSCPAGTVWYQSLQVCDWSSIVPTAPPTAAPTTAAPTTTEAPVPAPVATNCEGFADGTYLADPCDYAKFYLCSNGVAHAFFCHTGLEFNRLVKVCDWPEGAANPPKPATCP